MKKHSIIPIFIPEIACPNKCIYCNQKIITGKQKMPDIVTVKQIVETYLQTIPKTRTKEIAFFGGNFTGLPLKEQINFLSGIQPYLENGSINSIRLSTRPDYINKKVLDILKTYNVKTIELGAQSFFNDVLLASKRGHTSKDIVFAANLINEYGFDLGLQMMLGLPNDTKDKAYQTACEIVKLKANNTRIYPLVVIKNTELAFLYKKNKYTPLSIDEAVNWLKPIITLFESNNILIQRVGLHPSEGLISGDDFLAGVFHVSLKELAYSAIWKDILLKKINIKTPMQTETVFVSPKEINYAIGYKRQNKLFFKEKNNIDLQFKTDIKLINRECYVVFD